MTPQVRSFLIFLIAGALLSVVFLFFRKEKVLSFVEHEASMHAPAPEFKKQKLPLKVDKEIGNTQTGQLFQTEKVLPWGSGEGQLGRNEGNESQPETPMALGFKGNELFILDQVNGRIVFSNRNNETISLPSQTATDVQFLENGNLLVLDRDGQKKIFELDNQGRVLQEKDLTDLVPEPGGITLIHQHGTLGTFIEYDNSRYLVVEKQRQRLLPGRPNPAGNRFFRAKKLNSNSVSLFALNNEGAMVWEVELDLEHELLHILSIDFDENGNIYLSHEEAEPHRTLVTKFNEDGSKLGVVSLPGLTRSSSPFRPIAVSADGTITMMIEAEDGLKIIQTKI